MNSGQSHRTCSTSGDNCHYPTMQEEFATVSGKEHLVPEELPARLPTASTKSHLGLLTLLKQGWGVVN